MANITQKPGQQAPTGVEQLVVYRQQISYVLIAMGIALLGVPAYLIWKHTVQVAIGQYWAPFLWSICLSLTGLIFGVIGLSTGTPTPAAASSENDQFRLQLMAVGGLVGLFTALLGFVLPFTIYRETLGKGMEEWRANPMAIVWPALAQILGLGLMFASLQLGRGLERKSQNVRRLIYGYNALLMSLLLLNVLALPNVLAYAEPFTRFFGRPFDWTKSEVNTLSPMTRNFLADLQEPVKVLLIMPRNNEISMDTQTMLEYCRSLSNKFSWELVSPSDPQNRTRLQELMKKYTLSDPVGMLVTVGEGKSGGDHEFVRYRDLFQMRNEGRRPSPKVDYVGESALLNAMTSLTEGKVVIYLAQGHGELSAEMQNPGMRAPTRGSDSMSKLRTKLAERKSVEVKNLTIDRSTQKVPDDATVVIIARPTRAYNAGEVKVLRDYLQRKEEKDKDGKVLTTTGKLIVLLDPLIQREGGTASMVKTGLEPLLAGYNVRVGDNRILNLRTRDPLEVLGLTNPNSPNPIAKAFFPSVLERQIFQFRNARTVEPLNDKPGAGKAVDRLMLVPVDLEAWAESDLNKDPVALRDSLRENEAQADKLISQTPLCLGVTVSDSGGAGVPRDAAHSAMLKDTPRMIVFGTSSWITDDGMEGARATLQQDLFTSCLSWLREKASVGVSVPPRRRTEYDLKVPPTEGNRLRFLPLGLMVLAVFALGMGVWVVRRR